MTADQTVQETRVGGASTPLAPQSSTSEPNVGISYYEPIPTVGGWNPPTLHGKAHYYLRGAVNSLCWTYTYGGPRRTKTPPSADCCARCLRRYRYRQSHGRLA